MRLAAIILCLALLVGAACAAPSTTMTMGAGIFVSKLGYSEADPGMTYLLVPYSFQNNGYDEFPVEPGCCKVIINKVRYDRTYIGSSMAENGYPPLDSVTLMNGGSIKGWVAFEVPAGTQTFQSGYEQYSWNDYDIIAQTGVVVV
ncbi:MAG TPA: DUF4352 domain-containing protein [Methanotrichaceae archaeon]|nr:DUF4352 domain-containing protein [Methanotrichaceae archaeon]